MMHKDGEDIDVRQWIEGDHSNARPMTLVKSYFL